MEIKVKRINDKARMPLSMKGDMYDLYINEIAVVEEGFLQIGEKLDFKSLGYVDRFDCDTIFVKKGSTVVVKTGLAMELPDGYFAECYSRSSNYSKYGLILANSVGIIDHVYKGNNDEWIFVFYCTRDAKIKVDDRLVQFEVCKSKVKNFTFKEVETLENEDRGGYGSTDTLGGR